jgi:hypothetical protein
MTRCVSVNTCFHYLKEKLLPFDSYVANKIASCLTHVEVSSAIPHKGDKIYSHPQNPNVTDVAVGRGVPDLCSVDVFCQ